MDELELLSRSRLDIAPSPGTVARHRRALADAIETLGLEPYPAPDHPGRRRRLPAFASAALVLAGVAVAQLSPGDDHSTRVVTAPPATQSTTTTLYPSTIVPCAHTCRRRSPTAHPTTATKDGSRVDQRPHLRLPDRK